MKIAIIGAGWMGCHLSYAFSKKGYNIKLYEKSVDIFSGMSGFNTNRLHKGYHYPRSKITRLQSFYGYKKFIRFYPNFFLKIQNNYIAIAKKNSLVNFETYKTIMKSSNLKINETLEFDSDLIGAEGVIKVDECLILFKKAKIFFKKKLKKNLKLNTFIKKLKYYQNSIGIGNELFDWVIDCTACHLNSNKKFKISFEPRITLIYKSNIKNLALMFMDGNFFNIFPYKKNLYLLGTPDFSKFRCFKNVNNAKKFLNKITKNEIKRRIIKSEKHVLKYYPKFKQKFKYVGFFKSLTTLFNSKSDSRPTLIDIDNKLITVLGGKIDTIFQAEEKIFNILKN